jgi:hypothetical protein
MYGKQLVTVLEWYTEYIERRPSESRGEIAMAWHELMAPAKADPEVHTRTARGLPDTRSHFRKEFCRKILQTASSVREALRPLDQSVGKVLRCQVVSLFSSQRFRREANLI